MQLSHADTIDHVLTLSSVDPTVLTVSPASITLAAGQTTAKPSITGVKAGVSSVIITSPTLATISVPVYVTTEFAGINTSYSASVGVVKETVPVVVPPFSVTPLLSPAVGVVLGNYLGGITPNTISVASGTISLTLSGSGLQGVSAVSVVPADGLTLGAISVSTDGTALTVPLTVAADAHTTLRQIVVTGAAGRYAPASAMADRLLVTLPAPEITSLEPLFSTAGVTRSLLVRGHNLQSAQSINLIPSQGITVGTAPVVSADGSQLTVDIAIAPTAALGSRVVTVTTPSGTTDATPNAYNTFTLVNEIQDTLTPIVAANVGVVKETTPLPPQNQAVSLTAPHVGIAVGSIVTSLTPATGSIGDTLLLNLNGNELQGVTALQLVPASGVTLTTPTVAADGRSITASLTIAADAPNIMRTLKVLAGTTAIPFSSPSGALFQITPQLPHSDSIEPLNIQIGAPAVTLTLRGRNLQNASQIRVVPAAGITVSTPPTVNADGTVISANIQVAASALAGERQVIVVTPAGESSATAVLGNTITLVNQLGESITPITAMPVGVVKEASVALPIAQEVGPIAAHNVGVVLQHVAAPPAATSAFLVSPSVGLALGPTASSVQASPLIPGSNGTLVVSGYELEAVTGAVTTPAEGLTLDIPTVNAGGNQVSIPVTVSASAAMVPYELNLTTATGRIPFANAAASRVYVGVPSLDSISPILAGQGNSFTLTLRGANLQRVVAVTATPAEGINFDPSPVVDASGTVVTLGMVVAPGAPLGLRVIQLHTQGGITTPDAVPANTFTVYAP